MSYFLISSSEGDNKIKQFRSKKQLIAHLKKYHSSYSMRFLNEVPDSLDEFFDVDLLLIAGRITRIVESEYLQ
jgi:hypothetical protein